MFTPTIVRPARNTPAVVFQLGRVRLYYSYNTIVAASTPSDRCIRENVWGPTTGRHMREWGFDKRLQVANEQEMHQFVKNSLVAEFQHCLREPFL